ncbi:MAG: hypothetical protein IJ789_03635 [Bacteroidales bacterium]|nr:hypothetical protein [Bacteroidales bacterium]
MKNIKILCITALLLFSLDAEAQFLQNERTQWMAKFELGVMPFMGNLGQSGNYGYYLGNYESAAGLSAIVGRNLSQDFMLGVGASGYYVANISTPADFKIAATLFVDLDFRPIWTGVGADHIPQTFRFAPMAGLRGGASVLLDDANRYSTNLTPYGEIYAGVNWYYRHGLRNMEHNWRSLYLQLGVAYMQQTVFLPVRLGWRL